jgi:hypothetical protein
MAKLTAVRPGVVMDLVLERNGNKTELWTMGADGCLHVKLATIGPQGFKRASNLRPSLGFPLDGSRIKLDE